MKNEEIDSIKNGVIIFNNNTQNEFIIIDIILDSRDPPEFLLKSTKTNKIYGPIFGTWLTDKNWILKHV